MITLTYHALAIMILSVAFLAFQAGDKRQERITDKRKKQAWKEEYDRLPKAVKR